MVAALPYKPTMLDRSRPDHTVITPQVWSVQPTDKGSFTLNQSRGATQDNSGSNVWHHVSYLFHSRLQLGTYREKYS